MCVVFGPYDSIRIQWQSHYPRQEGRQFRFWQRGTVCRPIELGAIIVSLSDSLGTVTAESDKGIGLDDLRDTVRLKKQREQLHKESLRHFDGSRPWQHVNTVDIALPCATQNELSKSDAE